MKTIRFKNDAYLLVSISDVCQYVKEKLNLTDKQIKVIEWEFKKYVIKNLSDDYKNGVIFNSLLIPDHDDYFLSWTRFWKLEQIIKKSNSDIYNLFLWLSDPTEIELNPLFEEIQ